MKILVLRFSSIGDIVLTTPVVRTLKSQLDAEVHYATKKPFETLLTNNPYLTKIHLLEDSLGTLIQELKKEQFDLIIDLHNNLRTRIVKARLGVKSYSFDKLNLKKWMLVRFKINKMPNMHIVDRYMDTLKPLGVEMDSLGLDYFIPEKDEVENSWLPVTHQNGYAVVVVGAAHNTKRLPTARLIELCDRINKPIVLIGGKQDVSIAHEIETFFQKGTQLEEKAIESLNKKAEIFNACGKFSINQSASLIKQSRWVITHDTGMMHVAAAFKKPVYSIWGSTVPSFGMYPYRTKFTIFENNKLDCRPCSKIGFDKCPKGHFKCMNEVVFDFWLPD